MLSDFQLLLLALEDIGDTLKEILHNQTKGSQIAKVDSFPDKKNDENTNKKNVEVALDTDYEIIWSEREFAEKYALELPIKELDDFLMFDEVLKENPDVRRDFVSI